MQMTSYNAYGVFSDGTHYTWTMIFIINLIRLFVWFVTALILAMTILKVKTETKTKWLK